MNKPACHTGTDVWQLQHLGRAACHHPLPAAKVYSCLTYMDPPTQSCLLPSLGMRNWPPSVSVWEGQKDARVITDYIPRVGTRPRTTQSPADIWAVPSSLLKAQSPAGHTQPDHVPKPEKQPQRQVRRGERRTQAALPGGGGKDQNHPESSGVLHPGRPNRHESRGKPRPDPSTYSLSKRQASLCQPR